MRVLILYLILYVLLWCFFCFTEVGLMLLFSFYVCVIAWPIWLICSGAAAYECGRKISAGGQTNLCGNIAVSLAAGFLISFIPALMLEMPDFFRYGHLDLFGILKQILPGTGRDPGSWLLFLLGAVTCIMLFTGAAAEGKKRRPKESGSENDVN